MSLNVLNFSQPTEKYVIFRVSNETLKIARIGDTFPSADNKGL